ncbi:SDR family NAD(P)-dependent oxidoreductase [Amorphus sp. 3PC139-8]|uniref:SDR family NAD(P)-dependent oxidoreductase n=1 Tax=Amorphus sp. 3PC139-8 TaxID=2735676 RepID=UPI00345CF071
MNLGLEGKVAVVSGGGRKDGIGWATIKELIEAGAKVLMGDIEIDPAYEELTGDGAVEVEKIDLSQAGNPERLVDRAIERFGKLDILINNLGVTIFRPGFLETTDDHWDMIFRTNFMSNVRASRTALPHLIESKGVIVNLASSLGTTPVPSLVDYSAFKSAVLNLTKTLSEEFSPQGVRVVAISPGAVLTPHWTRPGGALEMMAQEQGVDVETMKAEIPKMFGMTTGRMVWPEEIAAAICFAASNRVGSLTGTALSVDGGSVKTL